MFGARRPCEALPSCFGKKLKGWRSDWLCVWRCRRQERTRTESGHIQVRLGSVCFRLNGPKANRLCQLSLSKSAPRHRLEILTCAFTYGSNMCPSFAGGHMCLEGCGSLRKQWICQICQCLPLSQLRCAALASRRIAADAAVAASAQGAEVVDTFGGCPANRLCNMAVSLTWIIEALLESLMSWLYGRETDWLHS